MTWLIGRLIYVILILVAFLGYVLPWGQIRYWGATVISRLITTLPIIGKWLLIIIWGDYSVRNRTLNRFYTLHFIFPFLVVILILTHLMALHIKGRTSVIRTRKLILPFSNYFVLKDVLGLLFIVFALILNIIYFPRAILDNENSIIARSLVTPIHIVPEWYFLYAYCILKRYERKVFGVAILLLRVIFFVLLSIRKCTNNITHKIVIIAWVVNFIILTKIGAIELVYPYWIIRSICSIVHFTPLILGFTNV